MPSRKIITTLIVCSAAILSIWLMQRSTANSFNLKNSKDSVSSYSYEPTGNSTSTDWKKILISVDKKNEKIIDLTQKNDGVFEDTTLTSQLSKDFMSQYLILKKGGGAVTSENLDKITNNIIASPQYSQIPKVVYVPLNLHIAQTSDSASRKKYKDLVNLALKNRSLEVKDNPAMIIKAAANENDSSILDRMDVIINASKGLINDFLSIEVPSDAIKYHIDLMNSVSGVITSMESMREIYNDPVKGMIGLSQYNSDIVDFQKNLSLMNSYLEKIK